MKKFLLFLFFFGALRAVAQNDIVLDLDSIKNIKTTRYSSVNEVGVAISIGGTRIYKFSSNTTKDHLGIDKPSVMFRTVHGALINPHFFIGGGIGIDFLPSATANGTVSGSGYKITFPFFAELREYILDGSFNVFFSERMGAAVFIDPQLNKVGGNGKSTGAFGEFMIGGRYVTGGKKLAVHFGVGYRLQHLQRKIDVQNNIQGTPQTFANTPEITIKHYIPVVIGITF